MTKDTTSGVRLQEVLLHDGEGAEIGASNNLPISDVETQSLLTDIKVLMTLIDSKLLVDNEIEMLATIDEEHYLGHQGRLWTFAEKQGSLGTGTVQYSLVVPEGVEAHFVVEVFVYDGSVELALYKDSSHTGGSPVTAINHKLYEDGESPDTTLVSGVTSSDGSFFDGSFLGASNKAASGARGHNEWEAEGSEVRIDLIGLVSGTEAIIKITLYEI